MGTKATKLKGLVEYWKGCERCALHESRKSIVHYRGNPNSKMVLIGEAPGAEEDEQGIPFVGDSGKALNVLLKASGIDPEEVLITNTVACRPPSNREPKFGEWLLCKTRLLQILDIVQPQVLLLVGGTAAKRVASVSPITKWRGQNIDVELYDRSYGIYLTFDAIATFHPSYLIRNGGNFTIRNAMVSDINKAWEVANAR